MAQQSEGGNPLDPFAAFRAMRDASMDAWSKTMIEAVNTEEFARNMGAWLDGYLAVSAPLRKTLNSTMAEVLAHLNMPTRTEVTSIAERLTNIEMRLDDLDAKLDEMQSKPASPSSRRTTRGKAK